MYAIIWEYQVKADCFGPFEDVYGPDGRWVELFRRSGDYRGTTLLRDPQTLGRYVTIDVWTSRIACEAFQEEHREDYLMIDKDCDRLTLDETRVGAFETIESMVK